MRLVVAVIRPHQLDAVTTALAAAGVHGMTVSDVGGYGQQRGRTEVYRGAEYTAVLVPKVRVETIVEDAEVEDVAAAIIDAARTGAIGDGKVWTIPLDEVIRVRTGQRGPEAV